MIPFFKKKLPRPYVAYSSGFTSTTFPFHELHSLQRGWHKCLAYARDEKGKLLLARCKIYVSRKENAIQITCICDENREWRISNLLTIPTPINKP